MAAKKALKAQLISPGRIFIIAGHSNGQNRFHHRSAVSMGSQPTPRPDLHLSR